MILSILSGYFSSVFGIRTSLLKKQPFMSSSNSPSTASASAISLNVVPARTGIAWVKLGIKTFFKQPLALGGLFFMFMALISLVSQIPFIGAALALVVLPAATVGLMAATEIAASGKFPMPAVLFTAFKAGSKKTQAILTLGALYAVGFLLVLGVSALFDGGQFANFYLGGSGSGAMTKEIISTSEFQMATWAAMALYLPLSLMFWHAPALVHWHEVSPVKALFFSFVACFKNFGAMVVYFFMWLAVFSFGGLVLTLVAASTGSETAVSFVMLPAALLMAAMFFTSIYFTFKDSFETTSIHQ
jgi:hypothetical protein